MGFFSKMLGFLGWKAKDEESRFEGLLEKHNPHLETLEAETKKEKPRLIGYGLPVIVPTFQDFQKVRDFTLADFDDMSKYKEEQKQFFINRGIEQACEVNENVLNAHKDTVKSVELAFCHDPEMLPFETSYQERYWKETLFPLFRDRFIETLVVDPSRIVVKTAFTSPKTAADFGDYMENWEASFPSLESRVERPACPEAPEPKEIEKSIRYQTVPPCSFSNATARDAAEAKAKARVVILEEAVKDAIRFKSSFPDVTCQEHVLVFRLRSYEGFFATCEDIGYWVNVLLPLYQKTFLEETDLVSIETKTILTGNFNPPSPFIKGDPDDFVVWKVEIPHLPIENKEQLIYDDNQKYFDLGRDIGVDNNARLLRSWSESWVNILANICFDATAHKFTSEENQKYFRQEIMPSFIAGLKEGLHLPPRNVLYVEDFLGLHGPEGIMGGFNPPVPNETKIRLVDTELTGNNVIQDTERGSDKELSDQAPAFLKPEKDEQPVLHTAEKTYTHCPKADVVVWVPNFRRSLRQYKSLKEFFGSVANKTLPEKKEMFIAYCKESFYILGSRIAENPSILKHHLNKPKILFEFRDVNTPSRLKELLHRKGRTMFYEPGRVELLDACLEEFARGFLNKSSEIGEEKGVTLNATLRILKHDQYPSSDMKHQ